MKPRAFRRKRAIVASILASLTLLVGGCGPNTPHVSKSQLEMPQGDRPYQSVDKISQSVQANILRTYTGMMSKTMPDGTRPAQAFTLKLAKAEFTVSTPSGTRQETHGYVEFHSSGTRIGQIDFRELVGAVFLGYQTTSGVNGGMGQQVAVYSILSNTVRIPEFLSVNGQAQDTRIEIQLALTADGHIFPEQSKILIKDCSFSQFSGCYNSVQDVAFAVEWGKTVP